MTTSSIRRLVALAAVGSMFVAACGGDDSAATTTTEAPAPVTEAPAPEEDDDEATPDDGSPGRIVVGSANFPENHLLAEIYAQALEARGYDVGRQLNIGSREIYFQALVDGEIDLLPEYTNSLLSYALRQSDPAARPDATNITEQVAELKAALPEALTVLESSLAEDKDVIVCRQEVADEFSLTTLADLAAVADQITLGAPPEFETRAPFGLVGFNEIYGAEFQEFVPLPIGGVADSLRGGAIDCGNLFSTMSVITTAGLVAMEDEQTIVPHEAVVPVIRVDAVTPEVGEILNAVSAALTTDNLKAMMVLIEVDAADPAFVARTFVSSNGFS